MIFRILLAISFCFAREPLPAKRYEQLSGVKIKQGNAKKIWDAKYNRVNYVFGKAPAKFLADNYEYLPKKAKVLDMGMGEGRNAVFLAKKGFQVVGIDISSVAVRKSLSLAKEFNVRIKTIVASLKEHDFLENSFDAIICFYYVDRELNQKIRKWLRPGGVLIYESYTESNISKKDVNPEALHPEELLTFFPNMKILKYEEPLHERKFRASIILQKKGK